MPAAANCARVESWMFKLLGVTLLQPESIISARLPNGAEAIGELLTGLQRSLRDHYDEHVESAARTLCVVLGPERSPQVWLSTDEGVPSADELRHAESLAARVSAPAVKNGPVAMALVFSIGPEPPAEAALCLPDDWRAIIRASDTPLSVDQILLRLWSGAAADA